LPESSDALPYVEVWTDGSGTTAGNPGGWAYVMEYDNGRVPKESVGGARDATNNRMELSGPLMALRTLKKPCRVKIHTDSVYVANAFNQDWLGAWTRRKWVKVKNVDLWQALVAEVEKHDVEWAWVRGHATDVNNNRCDKLAGEARRAIIDCLETGTVELLEFELDDQWVHDAAEAQVRRDAMRRCAGAGPAGRGRGEARG
jgi:ribonuclease HI